MKIQTRNVNVLDGAQSTPPGTDTQQVPQPSLPTSRSLGGSALALPANANAERASRTDSSSRARAFRYGNPASDTAGVASNATIWPQAASTVRNLDALRKLAGEIAVSAKESASLDPHCEAIQTAANSVVNWKSWHDKVAGLRELEHVVSEMPPEIREARLGAVMDTAYEKAISSRAAHLASQIHSAQDLEDVLARPLLEEADGTHLWPDPRRDFIHAAFLEAAVDRLKAFPADEQAQGHEIISEAIIAPPPWVALWATYGANEKLEQLEADELLRPEVKAAYEEGERLARSAESVHDLMGLHALLSEPGIAGPNVPDDLLGLARLEHDGNLGLPAWPRPEPLAVLATRVGDFPSPEANHQAFSAIFDKVDGIDPPCRRVASLMALATAASQLGDSGREQAYGRVLNAARTQRESRQIDSRQYAFVLNALHQAIAQRKGADAGPAEQAALDAVRQAGGDEARARWGLAA